MIKFTKLYSVNLPLLGLLVYGLFALSGRKPNLGWILLALGVGCVFLFAVFRLIKKMFTRRKKKAKTKTSPGAILDLDRVWKRSLAELKKSKLRRRGNPVYALPWFLVLGDKGSGKTAALQSTGLSSVLNPKSYDPKFASTKNCEWFFFKEAIVIDTAGRYAIPENEKEDNQEWRHFLRLLKKYRRNEPLNGLILTVSADDLGAQKDLSSSQQEEVFRKGGEIRRKIDDLTETLGSKFPVFVLVTKMDKVMGMTQFVSYLKAIGKSDVPPEADKDELLAQAMGFTNEDLGEDWEDTFERAFSSVSDRLKAFRQSLVHQFEELAPESHLFPSEFDRLKANLLLFIKAVFQEDTYHERPYFRGLFFSGAAESRDPNPRYAELFDSEPQRPAERDKGIFLVDLFRNLLPSDRFLFQPTNFWGFVGRFIKSRPFVTCSAICAVLLLLISYAFVKNQVIADPDFPKPPWAITEDNLSQNLREFARFQSDIFKIEEMNRGWLLPKAGLTTFYLSRSLDIERDHKREFADKFDDYTLAGVTQAILHHIEGTENRSKYEELRADYVAYNIFKLLLIEDILKGKRPNTLNQFLYVSEILLEDNSEIPSYGKAAFGGLYYSYLSWLKDKEELEYQRDVVKRELQLLFEAGGRNLDWLTARWIHDTHDVTLADFWNPQERISKLSAEPEKKPSAERSQEIYVSGAFTLEGRKRIREYLESIEDVLVNSEIIAEDMKTFWSDYNRRYHQAWADFITRFDTGNQGIKTAPERQDLASLMITERNPYFDLLDRLATELQPIAEDPAAPQWVTLAIELDFIRKMSREEELFAQSSGVGKVVWKLYRGMEESVIQLTDEDQHVMQESRRTAAKVWQDYQRSLEDLKPVTESPTVCFKLISDEFSGESNTIYKSMNNFFYLKNLFLEGENNDLWEIVVKGPWRFLVQYACFVAAEKLQQKWETEVLSSPPEELYERVQNFVTKEAYPFIERDKQGHYRIPTVDRFGVPFSDAFVGFLQGLERTGQPALGYDQMYQVNLSTLPPNVNSSAKTRITEVVLEIPRDNVRWVNINRLDKKLIPWKPDASGEVVITIKIGEHATLKKTYSGDYPFVKFLEDFKDGHRTFYPSDFPPSESQKLVDLDVTEMEIFYAFGSEGLKILNTFRFGTKDMPREIVTI